MNQGIHHQKKARSPTIKPHALFWIFIPLPGLWKVLFNLDLPSYIHSHYFPFIPFFPSSLGESFLGWDVGVTLLAWGKLTISSIHPSCWLNHGSLWEPKWHRLWKLSQLEENSFFPCLSLYSVFLSEAMDEWGESGFWNWKWEKGVEGGETRNHWGEILVC